jgi:hypothetical protein
MSTHAWSLLSHLHRLAAPAAPDAVLLQRWVQQRDQHAFAVLMARHGPMVLGICRRLLGDVPERPISDLKNGLHMDRLSFHHFRANSLKLLEHTLAYALVVLHREATAALPDIARAEVSTLRTRLWKVGALVQTSARRVWFHVSASWPQRHLFVRVYQAVRQFVQSLAVPARAAPEMVLALPM